jgi:hypothetical protein
MRATVDPDLAATRSAVREEPGHHPGALAEADIEVDLRREAPNGTDADAERTGDARLDPSERGRRVGEAVASIERGDRETAVLAARDRRDEDPSGERVAQLVPSELGRREDRAIDDLGGDTGRRRDLADALADDRERRLVEHEDRVARAPLFDQKRFHFVTVMQVPCPTVDSSSKASTRRLLPESPRPIDLAVL